MAVNHYKLTEITTIVTVLHVIIFDLNCAYTESFFFLEIHGSLHILHDV